MSGVIWLCLGALVAATWSAALAMALRRFSGSALEQRMEAKGTQHRAAWLIDHDDDATFAVALVRATMRVAFVLLVVMSMIESWGKAEGGVPTWDIWLGSGAIAVIGLWVFTTVLANALARYAPLGLIVPVLPLVQGLTIGLKPIIRGLRFLDEMVKRLTGANLRDNEEAEQELLRNIEESQREGGLDEAAAEMLENIVEFSTTDVGEVMTPRTDIEGIELTDDLAAIRAHIIEAGHSRIPVYEENLDSITGILYVKDLIPFLGEEVDDFQLKPLLRKPIVVPETKSVRELLADFQQSEIHLAIVIDEYGGTAGLVTIEDILEEIVGEIHDEHDEGAADEEPALHRMNGVLAEVDGRYHIDDLNEELRLDLPEDEDYDTVGGFLLAQFGRVPGEGEQMETHGARFTLLNTQETHIERVRVELLAPGIPGNGNGNGGGK